MESILKAAGLKKYYGKGDTMVKALDGVDLEIENLPQLSVPQAAGNVRC